MERYEKRDRYVHHAHCTDCTRKEKDGDGYGLRGKLALTMEGLDVILDGEKKGELGILLSCDMELWVGVKGLYHNVT